MAKEKKRNKKKKEPYYTGVNPTPTDFKFGTIGCETCDFLEEMVAGSDIEFRQIRTDMYFTRQQWAEACRQPFEDKHGSVEAYADAIDCNVILWSPEGFIKHVYCFADRKDFDRWIESERSHCDKCQLHYPASDSDKECRFCARHRTS